MLAKGGGEFIEEVASPLPEALALTEQLLIAGSVTTTDALGMGLLLAQRPDMLDALRADRSRVETFVEEVLRLHSPPQGAFRIVVCDTENEGVAIKAGSRVMLRWAAANRDEDIFVNGEEVDLRLANVRSHLTFGYGIYSCQGSALARTELATVFR